METDGNIGFHFSISLPLLIQQMKFNVPQSHIQKGM